MQQRTCPSIAIPAGNTNPRGSWSFLGCVGQSMDVPQKVTQPPFHDCFLGHSHVDGYLLAQAPTYQKAAQGKAPLVPREVPEHRAGHSLMQGATGERLCW